MTQPMILGRILVQVCLSKVKISMATVYWIQRLRVLHVSPKLAGDTVILISDLQKADGTPHAAGDTVTAETKTVVAYDTDNDGEYAIDSFNAVDDNGDRVDVNGDGDPTNDFVVEKIKSKTSD